MCRMSSRSARNSASRSPGRSSQGASLLWPGSVLSGNWPRRPRGSRGPGAKRPAASEAAPRRHVGDRPGGARHRARHPGGLTRHLPGELRLTFADPAEPDLRMPTTDPGADLAALLASGRTPTSMVLPSWVSRVAPASPGYWAVRGLHAALDGDGRTAATGRCAPPRSRPAVRRPGLAPSAGARRTAGGPVNARDASGPADGASPTSARAGALDNMRTVSRRLIHVERFATGGVNRETSVYTAWNRLILNEAVGRGQRVMGGRHGGAIADAIHEQKVTRPSGLRRRRRVPRGTCGRTVDLKWTSRSTEPTN